MLSKQRSLTTRSVCKVFQISRTPAGPMQSKGLALPIYSLDGDDNHYDNDEDDDDDDDNTH